MGGVGGMGYVWGSGKSGIWIKAFLYIKLKKKKKGLGQQNSHEDPNLTMHWHRQIGNVAGQPILNPPTLQFDVGEKYQV